MHGAVKVIRGAQVKLAGYIETMMWDFQIHRTATTMAKHAQDPIDSIPMEDQKDVIDIVEDVEHNGKEETRERVIVTEEDVSAMAFSLPPHSPTPPPIWTLSLTSRTSVLDAKQIRTFFGSLSGYTFCKSTTRLSLDTATRSVYRKIWGSRSKNTLWLRP